METQDLDKILEAFRGIVYETATHMVGHAYKASTRDLRAIEERSLEDVLESAMGMNLTVSPSITDFNMFFLFYIYISEIVLFFYSLSWPNTRA